MHNFVQLRNINKSMLMLQVVVKTGAPVEFYDKDLYRKMQRLIVAEQDHACSTVSTNSMYIYIYEE